MGSKISIVIADDNLEFSKMISEYLTLQEGMEVVGIAHDGLEAIGLIEEHNPDVVILDVIMPKLDGLGVLEKLHEIKLAKQPITMILSAVGQEKITQRAIMLGAQYYFIKPFEKRRNCVIRIIERYKKVFWRYKYERSENCRFERGVAGNCSVGGY